MHKMPAAAALLYGLENTLGLSPPVRRAAVNGHLCQNLRPQGKMDFTALQIKVAEILGVFSNGRQRGKTEQYAFLRRIAL